MPSFGGVKPFLFIFNYSIQKDIEDNFLNALCYALYCGLYSLSDLYA